MKIIAAVTKDDSFEYDVWNRLYKRLPDGFYQILLEGKRPVDQQEGGIAVDDIFITSCSTFRECILIHPSNTYF